MSTTSGQKSSHDQEHPTIHGGGQTEHHDCGGCDGALLGRLINVGHDGLVDIGEARVDLSVGLDLDANVGHLDVLQDIGHDLMC